MMIFSADFVGKQVECRANLRTQSTLVHTQHSSKGFPMKKIVSYLILTFTFCVFFFSLNVAWAQTSGVEVQSQTIATQIAKIVFDLLAVIIPILATWIAHRAIGAFERKTEMDIPDKEEAMIDRWIEQGIHMAAEKSYRAVKSKTEKLSGPEKLEEAVGFVLSMANARGLHKWTEEKVVSKIDATLGAYRKSDTPLKLESKA